MMDIRILNDVSAKNNSTRLFMICMVGVVTFLYSCLTEKAQADIRPNIIFIMSDDHASAAIGCYGSEIVSTPNIDRIAKDGIRFTNAFVTSSLCAPSRAAILSGQYASKSGFKRIGDVFDGSQQTLPKLLQKGGYETAILGKWHLKSQPTGFNYYEVVRGQGQLFDPVFFKSGMEWNVDSDRGGKKGIGETSMGYFSDVLTDKSIDWLEKRKSETPFALFVHHKAPHSPHLSPEKYDSLFTTDLPRPKTFDDTFEDNTSFLKNEDAPYSKIKNTHAGDIINSREAWVKIRKGEYEAPRVRGTEEYKEWAYQTMLKGYYRQIVNLDENVGRLLDYIEETGLDENTIIVYVSDNGWLLGDHGLYNKMWMYDESLKIPLIIRYPDHISGNRLEDSFVSCLDFAPTLLDYAGVETPPFMQGRSLKPILEGKKPDDWRTSFFYHYYDQWGVPEHYGLRTQDYKLIKFIDSTRTEYELYDLKADPEELHNIFDDPKNKRVRSSLLRELQQEQEKFE